MSYPAMVTLHILVGSGALLLYWGALLALKGSLRHKAAGRLFLAALIVVAASVGPLLALRPGAFDPGHAVQFTYLSACLLTVAMIGWSAIRWKADLERFRGWHFKIMGPVLFALGLVVLAAGFARRDPVAAVLSWVGLGYGAAMLRFAWMRAPALPTWWLNWHLNAVCGLFTAVHGTFLFVTWRFLVQPDAGQATAALFHLGVLGVAIGLRLWFGRQRGVPLRFAEHGRGTVAVRAAG